MVALHQEAQEGFPGYLKINKALYWRDMAKDKMCESCMMPFSKDPGVRESGTYCLSLIHI